MNLGAHGQMQGIAAHWGKWMFSQGGMSPLEPIRAAPLNGAYYIGMDHELGSIEEGKLADLMILSETPLVAIEQPTFWFERDGASDASVCRDGFTYEGAKCACEVH